MKKSSTIGPVVFPSSVALNMAVSAWTRPRNAASCAESPVFGRLNWSVTSGGSVRSGSPPGAVEELLLAVGVGVDEELAAGVGIAVVGVDVAAEVPLVPLLIFAAGCVLPQAAAVT